MRKITTTYRLAGLALALRGIVTPREGGDDDDDDDDGERLGRIEATLATLLTRHGTQEAVSRQLVIDNFRDRTKRRTAERQVKELRDKMPEGSVVLNKDQAAQWAAYQALGTPEEVTKSVTEGKAAIEANAARDRKESHAKAAGALGFNAEVFAHLVESQGLEVVTTQGSVDGKPVDIVSIKKGDAAPVPAKEYAQQHWGLFAASLTSNVTPPPNGQHGGAPPNPSFGGAPPAGGGGPVWPPQGGGGGNQGTNVDEIVKKFNDQRAQQTNPLMPTPPATTTQQ